mgnify:CR=1 FL=1
MGDHQGNGKVGSAIRQVQGQFRSMKDALETRYGRRIEGDHRCIPWLMMHAAAVVSRSRKGSDGLTAYRRWQGRKFNRDMATIEHIIPLARGGEHTFENTVLACRFCNISKNAKSVDEFKKDLNN